MASDGIINMGKRLFVFGRRRPIDWGCVSPFRFPLLILLPTTAYSAVFYYLLFVNVNGDRLGYEDASWFFVMSVGGKLLSGMGIVGTLALIAGFARLISSWNVNVGVSGYRRFKDTCWLLGALLFQPIVFNFFLRLFGIIGKF